MVPSIDITCLYDFCYFITISQSSESRRKNHDELIKLYINTLEQHGYQYSKDQFYKDYSVVMLFVFFNLSAYLMMNYFQGYGNILRERTAWTERIYDVIHDIDYDLISTIINIDKNYLYQTVQDLNIKKFMT